jgi:phenylalanyl-tRNA synthetase beta chain
MNISVAWMNQYLSPDHAVTADEAEETLMSLGFPIESREEKGSDTVLDVEVTSNRGDVLCHVGMAREIAARAGARATLPATGVAEEDGSEIAGALTLTNEVPENCPYFTARVIRGVKVGPSPSWLRERLEAVGQRSINNIVDVTNFIAYELGNPCHVFDLSKLAGAGLVVRMAREGEKLTTLDGKARTLRADEVVVADGERAQSLAGVIGGSESEVSHSTVDVVLEMATWEPVAVRRASRRHAVRTDASHRFERVVDARTIEWAAARAAALIVEVAGGRALKGVLKAGRELAPAREVELRPRRCRAVLGVNITDEEIVAALSSLEIVCEGTGDGTGTVRCRVPVWRPDLTREVDLIEEVARVRGLDMIPTLAAIPVTPGAPQRSESRRRALGTLLTGLGFYETVTFSFVSRESAAAFMPAGMSAIEIHDDQRKAAPACRPSVIPGLLTSRTANQHAGVRPTGGVRFFETAAVFAQDSSGAAVERQNLGLLMDVPVQGRRWSAADVQAGVRVMRGVVEAVVYEVVGAGRAVEFAPAEPHCPGFDANVYARISVDGVGLGYAGLVSEGMMKQHDLGGPCVACELDLGWILSAEGTRAAVEMPAQFPGIERDVSFIVPEDVSWADVSREVAAHPAAGLVGHAFVAAFRGGQIGAGRKSLTLRLTFRDATRTLRHEEADGPVAEVVGRIKARFGAEVRG